MLPLDASSGLGNKEAGCDSARKMRKAKISCGV
jgi:hypothetical protein